MKDDANKKVSDYTSVQIDDDTVSASTITTSEQQHQQSFVNNHADDTTNKNPASYYNPFANPLAGNVNRISIVKPGGEWTNPNDNATNITHHEDEYDESDSSNIAYETMIQQIQQRRHTSKYKIRLVFFTTLTVIIFSSLVAYLAVTSSSSSPPDDNDDDNIPKNTEDDNENNPPSSPSSPSIVYHDYRQRYNGNVWLERMDDNVQIPQVERILAGYTQYYVRNGGAGHPGFVTTECRIMGQTLHYPPKKQWPGEEEEEEQRDDDDDDTVTSTRQRQLKLPAATTDQRHNNNGHYLDVRFTMIFASSVTNVTKGNFPQLFHDFMNSKRGQALFVKDLQKVGMAVEDVADVEDDDDAGGGGGGELSPTVAPSVVIITEVPTVSPSVETEEPTMEHDDDTCEELGQSFCAEIENDKRQCLDMRTGGSCKRNVYLKKCKYVLNQKWYYVPTKRIIRNAWDGSCLDWDIGDSQGRGDDNVYAKKDCHGEDNQQWVRNGKRIKSKYRKRGEKCLYSRGNDNLVVRDCDDEEEKQRFFPEARDFWWD